MGRKTNIINIIEQNTVAPFWENQYMNFIMAFTQFMDFKHIDIDEEEIEESEREEIIENGKKKIRTTLKIKNEQLVVSIKAYQEGQWLFEFEDVVETLEETSVGNSVGTKTIHIKKIQRDRIVTINGVDSVLLITEIASEDAKVYAIPVAVAEQLMIPDYDGEEISRDERFLYEIAQYKLNPYFVCNYD